VPELLPGIAVTPSVRLLRPLGKGGMGSVWIADHLTLGSHVVVKFMSDELARIPDAVQRFSREASAAFQIRHPHVVQMLDHGLTTDGTPFIVMELLEGEDLGKHIARLGKLPHLEVLRIVSQAGKALDRMHERGVVHRDIKPENIFLCEVGGGERFVKVLDFGIAKKADALGATHTGQMIGTPYYMSPEQMAVARDIDGRTDLWALGVVAFQALTGRRPFDGPTLGQVAVAIHTGDVPLMSSRDPLLPPAVDSWFKRACARDPRARFPTGKELADALEAALVRKPARTEYAAPTPLPGVAEEAPRTEPTLVVTGHAVPAPAMTAQPMPAQPMPYIPQIVDEDDEPEPRGSFGTVVWVVLLLAASGAGVWLYFNPAAMEHAIEWLHRLG